MSQEDRHNTPLGDRARRRVMAQRATRRSASLTLATTIIPGSGLLKTRYRRLGALILILLVLGIVAAAGVILMYGPTKAALAVAVRPVALLVAAGTLVFGGLIWVWTIILTHRGTVTPLMSASQRGGLRVWTAVLCVAVVLPLGTIVRYSLIQREILGSLFVAGQTEDTAEPDRTADVARPGSGLDPWENIPRVNMLLIGSDAGDDRIGVRTDSMIIASIEPSTGNTLMFSLPRNLERVPFPKTNPLYKLYPKGYNCGNECLLNAVWAEAVAHKELFKGYRNPGLATVRGVIEEITGLKLDYTTVVDLKGFEELVNAMGGVVVNVAQDLPIGGKITPSGQLVGVTGWIRKGTQRLDGFDALWFARSRVLSDDYDRMRRQRCLVGKILDQANPALMLQRYPELARVAKDNIQTDVSASDLPAWVDLVQRIKGASIRSLTFTSLNIDPSQPNFATIRWMIYSAIYPNLVVPTATPTKTSTKTPTTKATSTRTSTSTKSTTTSTKPTTDILVDLKDAC